jgi:hypothetical protein
MRLLVSDNPNSTAFPTRKGDICWNRYTSRRMYPLFCCLRSDIFDIGCHHQAIKDVSSSYDALIDLFESIENFLRRVDIYTKIPCTTAITEIIVKILIGLLSTLSLATQQIKQGRLSKLMLSDTIFNASMCRREIWKEATRRE